MSCDIFSRAERKNKEGGWEYIKSLHPFDNAPHYGIYAWLSGICNYSAIKPISDARGFPNDASQEVAKEHEYWGSDVRAASWLTVEELLSFNYDTLCKNNGNAAQTYREFLGPMFFESLDRLKEAGADRVVFWFDH